jgi:hypothetical protein
MPQAFAAAASAAKTGAPDAAKSKFPELFSNFNKL